MADEHLMQHAFRLGEISGRLDALKASIPAPSPKPLPSPRAEIERICREYGREVPPELSKALDDIENDLRLGSADQRA